MDSTFLRIVITPRPFWSAFAKGLLLGSGCLAAVWWFLAQWGTSWPVAAALILVSATAAAYGLRRPALQAVGESQLRRRLPFDWFCLAAWTAVLPLLTALSLDVVRCVPLTALTSTWMPFCLALVAAAATIGPALFLTARLAAGSDSPDHSTRHLTAALCGIAAAFSIVPTTIAVWWGIAAVGWVVAGGALLLAAWQWRNQSADRDRGAPVDQAVPSRVAGNDSPAAWLLDTLITLHAGAVAIVAAHLVSQVVIGVAFVVLSQIAGLLAGAALGMWWSARRGTAHDSGWRPLVSAGALLLLAAAFPLLTRLSLTLNAYVEQVWLAVTVRSLLAALSLAPFGLAIGRGLHRLVAESAHPPRDVALAPLAAFGVGAAALPAAGLAINTWIGVLSLAGLVLAAAMAWSGARRQVSFRGGAFAAAVCATVAAGLVWSRNYDPAVSARRLFSAQAAQEYRAGMDYGALGALDDGRLLAAVQGPTSTWTVWKHHACQLQLRENGVPRSVVSLDPAVFPQASAEIFPAVLPLVLHAAPDRVLLAGAGSSATLTACLAFPVRSVTCVESDPALLRIVRDLVPAHSGDSPFHDQRLSVLPVEPAIAAAADQPRYDVVILNNGQASLLSSAPQFTSDYYARWAARLAPEGVLCQRFQYVDHGPQAIRDMLRTLGSVFPQVAAFDTAPGEMLLIARASEKPLVDESLIERAEARHVRRVMSQVGFDWSVLLALTALDSRQAGEIASDGGAVNIPASGRFAFTLPPEVLRWGPKSAEVRELVSGRTTRMLAWLGESVDPSDIVKRLEDVAEQQRVIRDNPDAAWAYRKVVRHRLQERPRTAILPVAHEGLQRKLHPEDQRRKAFLLALGEAARQPAPDHDSIERVRRFVEPYDPLVSDFVHHEAALLLSRAAARDRRAELEHRLHTVYFNTGNDRSVRNVSEALSLVLDHPEAARDPLDRWELANALLEVLKHRWALRAAESEASRYAQSDAEQTLAAAQRAIQIMDELAPQVSVDPNDWRARRVVLERQLLRPLRTYRARHAAVPRQEPPEGFLPASGG